MVNIGEEYFIDADNCQYILCKRQTLKNRKTGEEYESSKTLGCYGDFKSALNGLLSYMDRNTVVSNEMTLDEALRAFRDNQNYVLSKFEEVKERL